MRVSVAQVSEHRDVVAYEGDTYRKIVRAMKTKVFKKARMNEEGVLDWQPCEVKQIGNGLLDLIEGRVRILERVEMW